MFFQERDPSEGPVPRLDTCLCMLLCISTLAIAEIIEEDESELINEAESDSCNLKKEDQGPGNVRKGLVTSLQLLGEFDGLLTSPQPVQPIANQAAMKAIMFVSGLAVGNGYYECVSMNDLPMNCCKYLFHFYLFI